MKKINKPTNTLKHFIMGLVVGLLIRLFLLIVQFSGFPNVLKTWTYFTIIGWFFITIVWLKGQYSSASNKPLYINKKWLDVILDILAGNIPFILSMLLWNSSV